MTAGDGPDERDADRTSDGDTQENPPDGDTSADAKHPPSEDSPAESAETAADEPETTDSDADGSETTTSEADADAGKSETADADASESGGTDGRSADSRGRQSRRTANRAHGAPESVAHGAPSGGVGQSDGSDADEENDSDDGETSDSNGDPQRPDGEPDDQQVARGQGARRAGARPAAGQRSVAEANTGEDADGDIQTAMEGTKEKIADAVDHAQEPIPGDDEGMFEGAPDDEEMPLTEHIEEMIKRLGVVIVIMAAVSLVTFPIADWLINTLWYSFLPGGPEECAGGVAQGDACPRVYHPLGLIFARLKVASLAGFIIALPAFVYQTYLFMRPGLYPHERRYYLASVPTSLVLALVGVAFAYFLVLPIIFTYFLAYSEPVADIAFGLTETFDLILLMMGLFAAIFQIPLFIMLAIMMGVTTRRWLLERRLLFWASFAGVAFLFSPDPTGMAPFIVAITMIVLFEGTLFVLGQTNR